MKRRNFLKVTGAAGAAMTLLGAGYYAVGRAPRSALLPWTAAGTYGDPRLNALSYAILAPNPHNRQPWSVVLEDEDSMHLFCDLDRRLPETDPYDRQIVIGLGAFIELLDQAAAASGYSLAISTFPEGEPDGDRLDTKPVATIRMRARDREHDPLFHSILERRSNKNPYDITRIPSARQLDALLSVSRDDVSVFTTTQNDLVSNLRDLTWNAFSAELQDDAAYRESVDLFRIGRAEIDRNPDGIDLGGPMLESLHLLGILSRQAAMDRSSTAFTESEKMFRKVMHDTNAYLWITTDDNSRASQLAAGRSYVRLNQQATLLGIDMHPVSQALQEYQAVAPLHEALNDLLHVQAPRRIQMLARVGFGTEIGPSPRWPLAARIQGQS